MDVEKFVKNVKFYCARKDVKPTVACRESGAGERLLENTKRGSIPSVEKVQQLAQYLGATVSELLGETPEQKAATLHDSGLIVGHAETLRLTVAEVKLALAYRAADQHTRDLVDLALAPFGGKASGAAG